MYYKQKQNFIHNKITKIGTAVIGFTAVPIFQACLLYTSYRDMALKAFREATKNAELYSVPRQQLIDIIDAIYEGGGKKDVYKRQA